MKAQIYYLISKWPFFNAIVIALLAPLARRSLWWGKIQLALRISNGLHRVLRKGDVAIQAGVCMDRNSSQFLEMLPLVSPGGLVIGVDPIYENICGALAAATRRFPRARFHLEMKALSDKSGEATLRLGTASEHNQLEGLGPKTGALTDATARVQTITLDELLKVHGFDIHKVRHINLTINRAELKALRGARDFLERTKCCSITAVVRSKLDQQVLRVYLHQFGFDTTFVEFWPGMYPHGYVVARKGEISWFW